MMYVILVYDIAMDGNGARVSRNVFKICKKYLMHVQCSVFEGELSKVQIKKLKAEIQAWIRDDQDSIILFQSRNERWLDKDIMGRQDVTVDNFL